VIRGDTKDPSRYKFWRMLKLSSGVQLKDPLLHSVAPREPLFTYVVLMRMDVDPFDEEANLELALSFSDRDIRRLVESVITTRQDVSERRCAQMSAAFEEEIKLLDFGAALVATLDLVFSDRDKHNLPTVWSSGSTPSAFYFQVLLHSIGESIDSIRRLVLCGANGQARTVFRYLVETCDATIACVGDKEMFDAFSKAPSDDESSLNHWRSWLSPGVVRATVAKVEESEFQMDSRTRCQTKQIRETVYSWLSKFSHVDLIGYGVQSTDGHVEMAGATLRWTLLYLFLFLITLRHLLLAKHDWFGGDVRDRPDAKQCDLQEKLCFLMIQRFQEIYLDYRRMEASDTDCTSAIE
jgi:hypothetical protein